MHKVLGTIFLILRSGVLGLLISLTIFALLDKQPVREWAMAFFWTLIYYLISAPLIYLPSILLLRRLLKGYSPAFLYPVVAAFVGVVPTLLIIYTWDGDWRDVELWLRLYAVYVPVGILFGMGYVRLNRPKAA